MELYEVVSDATGQNAGSVRPVSEASFADVIAFVAIAPGLSNKQRQDIRAALATLFKTIKHDPAGVPLVDPMAVLQRLHKELNKAKIGPKARTARNIRYRCTRALNLYLEAASYLPPEPATPMPLPAPWQHLLDLPRPKGTGFSPKRFIRFAASAGLEPPQVDKATVDQFAATITDMKHASLHLYHLRRWWNGLANGDEPAGLRRLPEQRAPRRKYSPERHELSPGLLTDIDSYFEGRRHGAPQAERVRRRIRQASRMPLLKPNSAVRGRGLVFQYLGLLRQEGIDVGAFANLGEAITLDNIDTAIYALLDRLGVESSSQANGMAFTVIAIARHYLRWPEADLNQVRDWFAEEIRHDYQSMVARNIERLLVLKDPRHRRNLLRLPSTLMVLAEQSDSERGAYLAQIAVAIELLLQTAMRIGNLSQLRFGGHVKFTSVGTASHAFVMVEPHEVKNSEPVRIELGADTARMLNHYRQIYLPRLRNGGGKDYLFPGENGTPKTIATLSQQIKQRIHDHTGLDIHPHLFRAIAVFIYLRRHRGDLLTMQRVLGDRSLAVVRKHYSFLDQIECRTNYQNTVEADRQELGVLPWDARRRRAA
jgi:integrase